MNWLRKIGEQWFLKSKSLPKIIIVGIDTHCYQLAQTLIEHKDAEVVAFIDDEPWTNRTELLGAKVHYPSDMAALVTRKQVRLIIDFDTSEQVPESIQQELQSLPVEQIVLSHAMPQPLTCWRTQILEQLK
ncbi:nucleoside-diphosphate sugar epimerase/dehydratase [Marinomonas fungiae]|uniref:RCK N-terminal domain-containing protein n=1 Tax=Marinomonas fungiae TaxID=1137284 RepID=A0A0K6IJF8_9GAMM|nr:hypothetical protein [Marinomonas fungiae]CUB03206.1 hypothetical protein Ga0061065_10355 [Marinomonas fungiae]